MAHSYKYSIIKAIPDARRGERINIGILIFKGGVLDIRFQDASKKMKALTGQTWAKEIEAIPAQLNQIVKNFKTFEEKFLAIKDFGAPFSLSDPGWFQAENLNIYENHITQILKSLIKSPKAKREILHHTRINTEINKVFKKAKAIAGKEEGIESHKIVRDFTISEENDLKADFALKNGAFHFTATLDLRSHAFLEKKKESALKAITLDFAKEAFGEETKTYTVFALTKRLEREFIPHVHIMEKFSDKVFNWESTEERKTYERLIFDALNPPSNFNLN